MDNNLPNDPFAPRSSAPDEVGSNPNSNNPVPDPPVGGLPPFGSNFNPHVNLPDPNNPYTSQPPQPSNPPLSSEASAQENHHPTHSDVAKHRQRDSHGHFLPEHPMNTQPQIPPTTPNPAPSLGDEPTSGVGLPPLIETNPKEEKPDSDPPIVTVRNPITYIKKWWNKILAKEGIDFKLGFKIRPITAVLIASIVISGGLGSGITALVFKTFWPTSSPILHRQIIQQGTIQKSATSGFYLTSSDQSIWKLKAKNPNIKFNDQMGKLVTVTGNMTSEKNLIEVSEIIIFDSP